MLNGRQNRLARSAPRERVVGKLQGEEKKGGRGMWDEAKLVIVSNPNA